MNPQNNLRVFQNPKALAQAAAELMIEISKQAIKSRGRFVIALSGGTTPENLYTLLTKPSYSEQIPWEKTFVFWGDERFVPSDDNLNNAHMAKHLLLNHIDIPSININPIPVDVEPEEAAKKYESTIKEFFGKDAPHFDLIFLGLGDDGHTASLFPGSKLIFEKTRFVWAAYVAEQNMYRITMTPLLINKSYNIMFLVEGEKKAGILNTVLYGSQQPDKFPAQIINTDEGELYWFVDQKAAALLTN